MFRNAAVGAAEGWPETGGEVMAEQNVIVVKNEKSMAVAYILLIFLGTLGIHRFYLGRVGTGITMLILGLVGYATSWMMIGFIPLGIVGIWWIVDLFLTAGMVNQENAKIHGGLA